MKRRDFLTRSTGILVALTALPAGLLPADPAHAVSASGALGAQILAQTNATRRSAGLSPLQASSALNRAAEDYVRRLAAAGRLSHSLDGRNPGERVRAFGYRWRAVGENIAMASARGSDTQIAAGLVSQWMGSSGHRRNILARKYSQIGVAGIKAGGRAYGIQIFAKPR